MRQATFRLRRAEPASDAELLTQIAQGDTTALGELYDRYAAPLTRYAARLDRGDAEDVVQTVFMRVLKVAGNYRATAPSARPWLYAIAAHVLQERSRALTRLKRAMFRLGEHAPSSALGSNDAQLDLERGVAQLSRAKSTVLLLHEVEGFSCDEIAQMLSIPVGTVWTRLHHARQELRGYYSGRET